MNQELIDYLDTHEIEILRPILDKKDGDEAIGHCLKTKSLENYQADFDNLVFFLKNFNQPYYAVDGYNFIDGIHNIYIHKIY